MTENRVVIYSNGIADFQRSYQVEPTAPLQISIPVRQDHLADVLSSFNVYGNVKLESPPTFRPSNELAGNITINPKQVLEDLATNLSGAKVRVERAGGPIEGTLIGLHQEEEATPGEPIHPKSLIVLADGGLRRCVLRDIQSLQFLDDDVQQEIDKALQRNYQRIKPNSTFVELVLSAQQEQTAAIVQYTIPAAAWKISYRLRMVEDSETELQGFAIVDNNTDEDWNNFQVCVVTGEPITFSTDLAESKTPRRNHVNLVSEMALGSVEVAAAMGGGSVDYGEGDTIAMLETPTAADRKMYRMASMDATTEALQAADVESAEVHETGDFSIFESASPVTIPAKRSTVIPVFNVSVADTKSVLHYKYQNHPDRPYRSVDFTNSSGISLGRGVCTVYQESAYAGNCIVPALKPGESRLLPHALETGVSVQRELRRQQDKVVALRLSAGFCYTSTRQKRETHYYVKNNRDLPYELVLDHDDMLVEPDVEAQLTADGSDNELEATSKLADGRRYTITLAPKSQLLLKIAEQRIAQSRVELVISTKRHEVVKIEWLEQNLVATNGPLAQEPGVQECLRIQQELEAKQQDVTTAINETERLAERQERLRKNIQAGGQDELTSRWRNELDEAEQAIKQIEEDRIPALRNEEQALTAKLKDELRSLSAEWEADSA